MKNMKLDDSSAIEIVPDEGFSLQPYYQQLREALAALTTNGALLFKVEGHEEPFIFENVVLSAESQTVGVSLRKVDTRPRLSSRDKDELKKFLKLKDHSEPSTKETSAATEVVNSLAPLEWAVLKSVRAHGGSLTVSGYVLEHQHISVEDVYNAAYSLQGKNLVFCASGADPWDTRMDLTNYSKTLLKW